MKYAKNKHSILHNLSVLIADMSSNEQQAFLLKASPKQVNGKQKAYARLFQQLCELIKKGKSAEEICLQDIREWNEKELVSKNIENLISDLYDTLLLFMGTLFKNRDTEKWQLELEEGLYAVQELIERRLTDQAALLMNRLEKKLP